MAKQADRSGKFCNNPDHKRFAWSDKKLAVVCRDCRGYKPMNRSVRLLP